MRFSCSNLVRDGPHTHTPLMHGMYYDAKPSATSICYVKCLCKVYDTLANSVWVRHRSWSVEIISKHLTEIQWETISLAPGLSYFPITFLHQPLHC